MLIEIPSSAGIGIWYAEIQNRLSSNNGTESLTLCEVLESIVVKQDLRWNQTTRMETCDDTINTQTFMDTTILGGYYVLGYLSYSLAINFFRQGILLRKFDMVEIPTKRQKNVIFLIFQGHFSLVPDWLD